LVQHWQPVQFTGPDDPAVGLYQGRPGRVIDLGQFPLEVSVGFVNGPSHCVTPHDLLPLTEEQYRERGRRLVALKHPLRNESVQRYNAKGHEWIDGPEPSDRCC
jgi:hypothetical protein